ncbi:MAG: hypothetical protein DMG16_20050 [Acidobacteria bacterium]|nr:MAG: hypothetical protein DMG16_20050 [Acidobacteriota bacterium]
MPLVANAQLDLAIRIPPFISLAIIGTSREDDLPIDSIKRRVVILSLIFPGGLLNCINSNPVPPGN